VGETRVDLQHLLEDLRDAYTGALEETILTEIAANALDSGATRIVFAPDAADATLTVLDNGRGMRRRELARYHDVATSTKSRGDGIGFAGVGIKLGLLVAREVLTESRRGRAHVATTWHLATRYRAPWKWTPPPGLVAERGTAVRLRLNNPLSPLLDAGYLEDTIRHHFSPLLDPAFQDLLRRHYAGEIVFEVAGQPVRPPITGRDRVVIPIRLGRKRLPSAVAVMERHTVPLPEDQHGMAISTFGKVIKSGWEWLGLTPVAPFRVSGIVEAPDLAACLTLSKNDFVRTGPRGATYLAFRKGIQEVVSRQLLAWGDVRDETPPRTERLQRDLERVLEDLSDDFPLLRSLVDHRRGGQRSLPLPGRGGEAVPGRLFADAARDARQNVGAEPGEGDPRAGSEGGSAPTEPVHEGEGRGGEAGGGAPEAVAVAQADTVPGRRRPARYGLNVQFESRSDDPELARLVESTIWINEAHPAYTRAAASRSIGYHTALSVALALAPLAVEPAGEHGFVTQFMAQWGREARRRRG
jgi:hypothetical protein